MKRELQKIARYILSRAKSLPIRVFLFSKQGILARFTNNGVHQNGFQDLFFYTLQVREKDGFITLSSNDCTKGGIEKALGQLRALVSKPLPLEARWKSTYPKVSEFYPLEINRSPQLAAQIIERELKSIREVRASANGYFSAYVRHFYLADPNGLELYHPATAVRFGLTATKGSAKGYSSFYHPDLRQLDAACVTQEALRLAKEGMRKEVSTQPGDYECIFSPRAFVELMEPMRHHFDRDLYRRGKSIFSGSINKKIFSEAFTLSENIMERGQFGIPFDLEGNPKRKTVLIGKGVVNGFLGEGNITRGVREYSVYPENLVVGAGEIPFTQMFRKIKKGVFINKLRYHTLVRETGLEITGLATAGCLHIEGGEVVGRVEHLRYYDSLFSILRSISGLSRERFLLKDGETGACLLPYFWVSRLRVV